jgi:hypothetical protein
MRMRFAVCLAAGVGAIGLFGASPASAAVEFGSTCQGNETAENYTLTTLASPGPLPLTAPSSGVITKVRTNLLPSLPISIPTSIKLLRSAGGTSYTVISQTEIAAGPGVTATDARMPVLAGDHLGLFGLPFTFGESPSPGVSFYCKALGAGSSLGAVKQNVQPGETANFPAVTDAQIPVVAVIEPDGDGDGYGDETQDKCPQGAATQAECPAIKLDALSLVGKNAVTLVVATSITAPIKVTGVAKLDKGKKANLKAAVKKAVAGKFTRIRLPFNSALQKKLKELGPSEQLTLKITAKATNIAGLVSTDRLSTKLKGQG